MFNFEGDFKSKRSINLGGSRQQQDKKELLRKAQLERKKREQSRKRERSALLIQSFYRGRKNAGLLRSKLRLQWDETFKKVNTGEVNSKLFFELLRGLVLFYRPTLDEGRAISLATLQSESNSLNDNENNRNISCDDMGIEKEIYIHTLRKGCYVFLSCFVHSGDSNLLKSLLFLTDSKNYRKTESTTETKKTILEILGSLIQKGMYQLLREYLIQLSEHSTETDVSKLLLRIFFYTSPQEELHKLSIKQLITYIMSVPLLPNRLKFEGILYFSRNLPFLEVLNQIAGEKLQIDESSLLPLLSNILAFGHKRVEKMDRETKLTYVKVLHDLVVRIPRNALEDSTTRPDIKTEIDSDESDEEYEGQSEVTPMETDEQLIQNKLQKWLKLMYEPAHLSSILQPLTSRDVTADQEEEFYLAIHLIINLLSRWPISRQNIFNYLLFNNDVPFLKVAWSTFKESALSSKLKETKIPNNLFSGEQFQMEWAAIILVIEIYARVLITLGDDEFFGDKNPLSIVEVVELSGILRNLTFNLYWNESQIELRNDVSGTSIPIIELRTISTKLLQQIHARESRKKFTPLDHWLMKSELNGIEQFANSVVAEEEEFRNEEKSNPKIVGSKLAILHNIPFVIPFEDRVYIFRRFVLGDKAHLPMANYFGPLHGAKAVIRRDHTFEDGYDHLNGLGAGLKSRIAITFIDRFGLEEAGIDGGGVFKEFLTGLARQAFDTDYGLFLNTVDQKLYPNPHAFAQEDTQLGHYEFLGRIMGKALYEGILVDVAFAGFFLSKLLGRLNFLDDLPTLDPELYRGLIYLKNCDREEVQNLSLTFTVISDELGVKKELELIPGGSKIPVTLENRIEYIYRVANYRLNDQIYKQCRAFFRGLTDLIEPNWLKMFNQQELQVLLGGAQVPIDLDDLKSNIVYEGKYFESHPVIKNFWEVVHEFKPDEKEKLVKFITSCSRPPLLGFKELSPKMCITSAGEDDTRLPTSSTCVNLLKLPQFSSKAILREKLRYAINSEAGFDLS